MPRKIGYKLNSILLVVLFIQFPNFVYSTSIESKTNPIVRFDFSNESNKTVVDISGNNCTGTLLNSAKVITIGTEKTGVYNVLDLGPLQGMFNLGTKTGELLGSLSDFTISTYFNISNDHEIDENGSTLFSFSNSLFANVGKNGMIMGSLSTMNFEISITNRDHEDYGNISFDYPALKGDWHHYAYVQKGNIGSIYLDGVLLRVKTINTVPSDVFAANKTATKYNFIGRSCYSEEQNLDQTMIYDFTIFDGALTETEIQQTLLFSADQIRLLNNATKAYRATSMTQATYLPKLIDRGTPKNMEVYSETNLLFSLQLSDLNEITFDQTNTIFLRTNSTSNILSNSEITKITFDDYETAAALISAKPIDFLVYPNPGKNSIQVMNANGIVKIYSITGQFVKSVLIENKSDFINIQDLKKGCYILQSGKAFNRFVKQ